jgi:hypothetical protein
VERAACLLKPAIAVKQWVRVGTGSHGSIKRIEYEPIVIVIAYGICDDATIEQIQNGAKIYLVNF